MKVFPISYQEVTIVHLGVTNILLASWCIYHTHLRKQVFKAILSHRSLGKKSTNSAKVSRLAHNNHNMHTLIGVYVQFHLYDPFVHWHTRSSTKVVRCTYTSESTLTVMELCGGQFVATIQLFIYLISVIVFFMPQRRLACSFGQGGGVRLAFKSESNNVNIHGIW